MPMSVSNFFFNVVTAINNRKDIFNGMINSDTTSLSFQGKYRKPKQGDIALSYVKSL